MDSNKLYIRNTIKEKKRQYTKTKRNKHILEAAVLKGVYYGFGGTKIIPLPNYCSSIVNIVASISKSKCRFNGDVLKDLDKLVNTILKYTNDSIDIKIDVSGDSSLLELFFKKSDKKVKIDIKLPLTNKGIAEIAAILIRQLSIKYTFTDDEIDTIKETIEVYLYYIDRRF